MVSSGVRFGLKCRAPHGFVKPHHRGAGSGLAITVAVVTRTQSWFVGTLAVYAATWVWSWSRLAQRVPTHFGADGQVDQWSSRGSALLLTALLGVGATAFFVAVTAMVNHGRPSLVNIPNAHYWSQPAHLARMRQLVTEDLWLFGAWTVLLLTSIEVVIVSAADMPRPTIAPWASVCLVVYVVGVAARIWYMYRHRYDVPAPPSA